MNAIPKSDRQNPRRTRQMGMCEELAALGMELARAAAREALSELQAPIEHRKPGMGAPPTCRAEEPGVLFTKFARAVRQAILLENRIAEGLDLARPPAAPREPAPGHATSAQTDFGRFRAENLEPLEDDLAGEACRSTPEILAAIQAELHPDHVRGQTSYPGLPVLQPPAIKPVIVQQPNRILYPPPLRNPGPTGTPPKPRRNTPTN